MTKLIISVILFIKEHIIFFDFNKKEKRAFIIILISTFFYGFFLGFIRVRDIIARKAFDASDFQLSLLIMIFPVMNFLSIWWGKLLENSRNKSKYFILISLFGRLILIIGFWITTMNQFLLLMFFLFLFHSAFIPARNSLFQSNFSPEKRGMLFGVTLSLTTLIGMGFSYVSGRILDVNELYFKYILVGIGIIGFFNTFVLYFVDIKKKKKKKFNKVKKSIIKVILDPIKRAKYILREKTEFARFEISFILYGMGFIMMMLAVPIYLVDIMKFNYTMSFLSKAIIGQLGIFILSPFMGKLHDRWHPNLYNVFSFGFLIFYPLFLFLSNILHVETVSIIFVLIGFLFFGIARAAINIAWNMGSVYFAGDEDASMYQSIHVTFTGIRGVLAPLLGLAVKKIFSINGVFILSILFFIAASVFSYFSYKKYNY